MRPTPEQLETVRLVVDTTRGMPLDLGALRGGDLGPVEVEIGCGRGEFLAAVANRNPAVFYLGVEVSQKYALKTATRLVREEVTNAKVVWMDGHAFVEEAVPPCSLRAIHVYFPDPWPKRRHQRRRFVSPQFAAAAARGLRPGANLFFLTDDAEIHAHVVRVMDRAGGFVPQPFPVAVPWRPETGYERKWRRENRAIHAERWVRRGR